MKWYSLFIFIVLLVTAVGCSTGIYLKPIALSGENYIYSTENPACPGAEDVIELPVPGNEWITFRVKASFVNYVNDPPGTKIIAYFKFNYSAFALSPNVTKAMYESERNEENLRYLKERNSKEYIITASSPLAEITLVDQSKITVSLPFFEQPFNSNKDKHYSIWGPKAVISSERLEGFSVKFPDIFINGNKMSVPIIKFTQDSDYYMPVLNC